MISKHPQNINHLADMLSENKHQNSQYMRIVSVLKHLRDTGAISLKEYNKAKDYYARLTGADIVIAN